MLKKLLLIWLVLLAACSTARQETAVSDAQTRQFQQYVNDLADPSMEGRGAGTAGIEKARDYLVRELERVGLEPALTGKTTFLQPFEIDLGVQVREQALAVISADGQTQALRPDLDFNALGFSADGIFKGKAVFIGYGIDSPEHNYNSFTALEPEELKYKVAVAYRYEPMDEERRSQWADDDKQSFGAWSAAAELAKKAEAAAQRGATALLIVNPPSHSAGVALKTARTTSGPSGPIPVFHISTETFERMLAEQTENPRVMAEQLQRQADQSKSVLAELRKIAGHVDLERPRATIANVAARLPGAGELANEIIVVGAHYDHLGYGEVGSLSGERAIHPGADDNASGIAGLLLLAEAIKQRVDADPLSPRRAALFMAFSGEERGLLGSAHFMQHVNDAGIEASQIVAMLNFDMIGRMRERRLFVLGVGSGDRWDDLLRAANRDVGLRLHFDSSATGTSDQVIFYTRRVPVLHFFTGVHSDYHRPSDTAEKINAAGGAEVVHLADALLWNLMCDPQRLAFREDESQDFHAHGSPMFRGHGAYLGVLPDYATLDAADGCRIQSAIAGGPAEKAGLQPGDTITKWNDRPVRNVRDLTAALAASEPNQTVQLTIQHAGKSLKIAVTLGAR